MDHRAAKWLSRRAGLRVLGLSLMALALIATLRVNLFTLAQIPRAITSVPWYDQWMMVQELALHERGQPLWQTLWPSYYGHRLVVPRLLFLADARWASLASLTWLTMSIQIAHLALLIALAWLLFGKRSLACFVVACTVVLNLSLSPYQMENFLWSNQVQFVLVYAAATASFLLLEAGKRRVLLVVLAAAAALICSYTMANGLLVWPVLVLEALYLRLRRGTVIVLALAGALVIASYLWNYQTAAMGMGVGGMLRHPLYAILFFGLVLAGPLNFLSIHWGTATAILALLPTIYLASRALRRFPAEQWVAALVAVILFLSLTSAGVVAGRMSPAWFAALHGTFPLPSRIFTPICLFWASVSLLVLYACWLRQRRPILLGFYGLLFSALMFTNVKRQLVAAEDWADFFRGCDAAGAAFLLDAPDEQLLSLLWPNRAERDERVTFLRQHRLAMFAEPRAAWPGKRVSELFAQAPPNRCLGAIEKTSAARVEGWAWDTETGRSPDDIVLADASGRIAGLARGGFRHGYYPGLLMESQPPPASHAHLRHSEWLGYVRPNADAPLTAYGVLPHEHKVCTIR